MYKLEASSMFFHSYKTPEIFAAMNKAGLNSVEFWMETPEFWMAGADIDELLEEKKRYPHLFPIAMHAPIFDLNPCSFNPKVAELSADCTLECIEMLEALGGGIVTIHPGKRTSKRPITHLDKERFHHYLGRLSDAAGKNVQIALENMPPAVNAHITTAPEMSEVLDEYSWLYFTFDYAHAQAAGEPFSFVELCRDRMVNIHASLGRTGKMHSPLAGTKEGEELKKVLSKIGYTGRVTYEFEDLNFGELTLEEKTAILTKETEWYRE
ncbi:MAG TPA: sugar phosphate isomerase/epimerase [Methanocorpusculum sp.]|nr:sugar phosphate isomerase/epimerase [Methanocorpusculum sp.]